MVGFSSWADLSDTCWSSSHRSSLRLVSCSVWDIWGRFTRGCVLPTWNWSQMIWKALLECGYKQYKREHFSTPAETFALLMCVGTVKMAAKSYFLPKYPRCDRYHLTLVMSLGLGCWTAVQRLCPHTCPVLSHQSWCLSPFIYRR